MLVITLKWKMKRYIVLHPLNRKFMLLISPRPQRPYQQHLRHQPNTNMCLFGWLKHVLFVAVYSGMLFQKRTVFCLDCVQVVGVSWIKKLLLLISIRFDWKQQATQWNLFMQAHAMVLFIDLSLGSVPSWSSRFPFDLKNPCVAVCSLSPADHKG